MIEIGKNSQATVKGVHILSVCDSLVPKAQKIIREIEHIIKMREHVLKISVASNYEKLGVLLKSLWEDYRRLMDKLESVALRSQVVVENITTTVGRSVFAQRLSGTTTYTGIVNYTALGSDATAPAVGNTQLGTEVYRKALSSGAYASNIAYLETFFTATETSGTYQEYGNFIDGSAGANTGQLFNRFTQAVTKSVTETLNVQSSITINDS